MTALAPVGFRLMALGDLDAVMAIEQASYQAPWSRNAFIREVTDNCTADYLVAETLDGQIVGYAGQWVLVDEGHVTNVAVSSTWRERGVGTGLLRELARRAWARGATRMTLEVRPSNAPARRLYEKLGFVARGRRRNYYSDSGEDAIVMWLDDLHPLIADARARGPGRG